MARSTKYNYLKNNLAKANAAKHRQKPLSPAPDPEPMSGSACHIAPEPNHEKPKAPAQKAKLDNARKRAKRGKESIQQLQEKLAQTQEDTAQRLAELASTIAAYQAALSDAQAKSASLSAALAYNSSRASTSCAQNMALLDRVSALREESKSTQQTFKTLEFELLKQLAAGSVREEGHRQRIALLEGELQDAEKEKMKLQRRCARFPKRLSKIVEKAKRKAKLDTRILEVRKK
jgi:chromosome segregation ATPase